MGEKYRQTIEEKIRELGAEKLRVYINHEGAYRHYLQHLEATLRNAGVRFVAKREEANLVFEGNQNPLYEQGQIIAFFQERQLMFAGSL